MITAASEIVRAAIGAAAEELRRRGMERDMRRLPRLFGDAFRERAQVVRVTLLTPTGDAGPLRERVARVIEEKFGAPSEVTERADPSLIGGAVLLFGDERIDLSIRGALERLATELRTPVPSLSKVSRK